MTQKMSKPSLEETNMQPFDGYAEWAGAGFENQTADDYKIPFLQILQGLSPQLTENEELRIGMIINTVTKEAFSGKTGIIFVPATTEHMFVEWKPRKLGGGFVGTHLPNSPEVAKAKQESTKFGKYFIGEATLFEGKPLRNELSETFYVYGMHIDDGVVSQAVIGFMSTKIKKYKEWMTKAKTIQITLQDGRRIPAPLFAHRYRLTTVGQHNNEGDFYNWDIKFDGESAIGARLAPTDPIVIAAMKVRDLLNSGQVRADYESQTGDTKQHGSDEIF